MPSHKNRALDFISPYFSSPPRIETTEESIEINICSSCPLPSKMMWTSSFRQWRTTRCLGLHERKKCLHSPQPARSKKKEAYSWGSSNNETTAHFHMNRTSNQLLTSSAKLIRSTAMWCQLTPWLLPLVTKAQCQSIHSLRNGYSPLQFIKM